MLVLACVFNLIHLSNPTTFSLVLYDCEYVVLRYVTSGQVGYVEKYVNNAAQTAAALKDIGDMYSLFIVGKGGRGNSPLTTGICDWEECPELGTIGDFLAASDFNINGSVLVVQQHRHAKKDVLDD